ncbi:MAG: hypothetical protein AMS21_06375 [Gemmatimonas sp. SG8_38_2]|nr:MAG: hypothetical protein AMS21_06375 [Gemmatimonas sp. SG8_38_2]
MGFRRILAIKLREVGDVVIWTSALQNLRSLSPEATIDVLVREQVEPVLRGQPWIDRVHTVQSRRPLHLARRLIALRAENYDLALGFYATNTLCRLIPLVGARQRVLYHHKHASTPRFSTFKLPDPGRLENAILRDHQVVRALGLESEPTRPKLELSTVERSRARESLLPHFPDLGKEGFKLLGLLPGGSRETKRYPKDLWLRLLERMADTQPHVRAAVFVDSELSVEWGLRAICEARGIPLFDDLDLRELIGLLSWTDVIVCNDSGPKHIAVALGARSLTLFGPTEVGEWHPYDQRIHPVVREDVPCRDLGPQDNEPFRYCTVPRCDHLSCLRQIDPDAVWTRARELLASLDKP